MRISFLRSDSTPFVRYCKIGLALIPILIFLFLVNKNYFLTPKLHFSYKPGGRVGAVKPTDLSVLVHTADRVNPWQITAESFPFAVTFPRAAREVEVRVRLNPSSQKYVTLAATGKNGEVFSKILSSLFLDTLDWNRITNGKISIWIRSENGGSAQAIRQYSSIAEFQADPPDLKKVTTVGIDPLAFTTIPDYQKAKAPVTLEHSFRGSHQMLVYASNETLHFSFEKVDLNRQKGPDRLLVRVASVRELDDSVTKTIKTLTVKDDGDEQANGKPGPAQKVEISIPNIQTGMYRITITASEDVIFRKVLSAQHTLSFNGNVWFADGPAYGENSFTPLTLRTNGTNLSFNASHSQGKQELFIKDRKYAIQNVKEKVRLEGVGGISSITVAKGDGVFASEGLTAVAPALLLSSPVAQSLNLAASPSAAGYDYIVANYQPRENPSSSARATYKFSDLSITGKDLNFSIEAPDVRTNHVTLGLQDIQVTLTRGPLPWKSIWQRAIHLGKKK